MMLDTQIVPRAKMVGGIVQAPRIVCLNASNLQRYFSLPLSTAAKDLGVCATSLKRCDGMRLKLAIFLSKS